MPKQKLQELIRMMIEDIGIAEKSLVGDKIGSYNQKFAEKWGKQLNKVFGERGASVDRMS